MTDNMTITAGDKIDFKKPGSGKGRPSVATVVANHGAYITATDRLGVEINVQCSWVRGTHSGAYARKSNEELAAAVVANAVVSDTVTEAIMGFEEAQECYTDIAEETAEA